MESRVAVRNYDVVYKRGMSERFGNRRGSVWM
jgi:hypothetical protein